MEGPWMLLLALAAVAVLYVLGPIIAHTYSRFRRPRLLHCPEAGTATEVQIDGPLAAMTAVPGPPRLYVAKCSLWPEREGCGERCLEQVP